MESSVKKRRKMGHSPPVAINFPFKTTRSQVFRNLRRQMERGGVYQYETGLESHISMPKTIQEASDKLRSVSLQQEMATEFVVNSIIQSKCTGSSPCVFHIGGLAGAGKSRTVENIVQDLNDIFVLRKNSCVELLCCCMSNAAKDCLAITCRNSGFDPDSFSTLSKAFAIPVINFSCDVTREKYNSFGKTLHRRMKALGGLRVLVIDEYTMVNIRMVIYIDCLLRIINFRPDIPFGGCVVLMLGDNRQNSTVIDNSYGMRTTSFASTSSAIHANLDTRQVDPNGRGETNGNHENRCTESTFFMDTNVADQNSPDGKLEHRQIYSQVFEKMFEGLKGVDFMSQNLTSILDTRLDGLNSLYRMVSAHNSTIFSLASDTGYSLVQDGEGEEIDDKEMVRIAEEMEREGLPSKSVQEKIACEFQDDKLDDIFMAVVNNPANHGALSGNSNVNSISFNPFCENLASANIKLKERFSDAVIGDTSDNFESMFSMFPKTGLVQSSLLQEIEHFVNLSKLDKRELEREWCRNVDACMHFAREAFTEIDKSHRERFYIVSQLGERIKGVGCTAVFELECLRVFNCLGRDPGCSDRLRLELFTRQRAIACSMRNAFWREGNDPIDQIPIVDYMKDNLKGLKTFLDNPGLTYPEMVNMAFEIQGKLTPSRNKSEQIPTEDDDNEDWMGIENNVSEDEDEETMYECRTDCPLGIDKGTSLLGRTSKLVEFHVAWKKWVSDFKPSDLTITRFWHLYLMVRLVQMKYFRGDRSGETMLEGENYVESTLRCRSIYCPPTSRVGDFHRGSWLRTLSLPVVSPREGASCHSIRKVFESNSKLLSAYSSLMSCICRSVNMNSLKRINQTKHSLAAMMGMSLMAMTTKMTDLTIDFPEPPHVNKAGMKAHLLSLNPLSYINSIFSSMVEEYFLIDSESVSSRCQAWTRERHPKMYDVIVHLLELFTRGAKVHKHASCLSFLLMERIIYSNTFYKMVSERLQGRAPGKDALQRSAVDTLEEIAHRIAECSESKKKGVKSIKSEDLERYNVGSGAVLITRSHEMKNAVADYVEKAMSKLTLGEQNTPTGAQRNQKHKVMSSESVTCRAKFVIGNMDVTYLFDRKKDLTLSDFSTLVSMIKMHQDPRNRGYFSGQRYLVSKFVDIQLFQNAKNRDPKQMSNTLRGALHNITRKKTMEVYKGKKVVFTESDVDGIHLAVSNAPSYKTKYGGVIMSIDMVNQELIFSVYVELLDTTLKIKQARRYLGGNSTNSKTYVYYLPFEAVVTKTIYSSQGETFNCDTVADLNSVSNQDAYVAITRNVNPLNLYVFRGDSSIGENLGNMVNTMHRDTVYQPCTGGLGGFPSCSFTDYSIQGPNGQQEAQNISLYDVNNGLLAAAHRFILSRNCGSGHSSLAFNQTWMTNTASMMLAHEKETEQKGTGLKHELDNLRKFFASTPTGRTGEMIYYESLSHSRLLELYTAVIRSVTHYNIKKNGLIPSDKKMEDHNKSFKGKGMYVNLHPSILFRSPSHASIEKLFFEVAPNSSTFVVFQMFVHFLFLSYELLNVCNACFAFLPGPCPTMNEFVRPLDWDTSKGMTESLPMIPNLAYESEAYETSETHATGERNPVLRTPILDGDEICNDITNNVRSIPNHILPSHECINQAINSMKQNLRRGGKFCRPSEVCGLSNHGCVSVASSSTYPPDLHYNKETGSVALASECNLYCITALYTKIAAASAIRTLNIDHSYQRDFPHSVRSQVKRSVDGKEVGCNEKAYEKYLFSDEMYNSKTISKCLIATVSRDILNCGVIYPLKRTQFSVHFKLSKVNSILKFVDDIKNLQSVLTSDFWDIFDGLCMYGITALAITEMPGNEFASYTTRDIRNNIFTGIGRVIKFTQHNYHGINSDCTNIGSSSQTNSLESFNSDIKRIVTNFMLDSLLSFFPRKNGSSTHEQKGKRLTFFFSVHVV